MEIYTDTMTASTPSFGMPLHATTSRVVSPCPQQLEIAVAPWGLVSGIAVTGDVDAVRVKGAFPVPTAWRPPIL